MALLRILLDTATPAPYIEGEAIRVRWDYRPLDTGDLQDPVGARLLIRRPDATVQTLVYGTDPEVIQDAEGRYHVDQILAMPGTWTFRAEATDADSGAAEITRAVQDSEVV